MLDFISVDMKNCDLAKRLQGLIFPVEKMPTQIDKGIETGNPANFIVYDGEQVVGIVGYYTNEDLPNHILINWFGVLPGFREKGYGTKIINWLIMLCRKRSEQYLITYTEKGQNDESISLYKKLGFEVKDYKNIEDVAKLTKLGVQNNYVSCCMNLKGKAVKEDFEKYNLHIADDILEIRSIKKKQDYKRKI